MNDDDDSTTIIEQNDVEEEENKELCHDNDDSTCSSHDSDDTDEILQTINNRSKIIPKKPLHHSTESAAATVTINIFNTNNNKRKRQHDLNSDDSDDDSSTSFEEKISRALNKNRNDSRESHRTYSETKNDNHNWNEGQQHDENKDLQKQQEEQMSSSSSTSSSSIDTMILKNRIRRPLSTILINKKNDHTTSKSLPTSTCQATSPANADSAASSSMATRQLHRESVLTPKTGNSSNVSNRYHTLCKQDDTIQHSPTRKENDDNYQSVDDFNRTNEEDDDSDKENDVESVDTEKLLYTIRHGKTIHNNSSITGTNDNALSTTTSKFDQNVTPTRDTGHVTSTDATATTTTPFDSAVTKNNVIILTTTNNNNNNNNDTKHQQINYDNINDNNNNDMNDIFELPEYDSDDDDDDGDDNGSISRPSIQIPATDVDQEEFQKDNENVRNTPIARIYQNRNVANNIGIETGTTITSNVQNDRVTTSHLSYNTVTIINSGAIDRDIGIPASTPNATVKPKCFNPYSKQDRATYDALKETPKIVHQQQQHKQTTPLQNPYSRSSLQNPYSHSSLKKGTALSSHSYDKIEEPQVTNIITAPSTIPAQKEQSIYSSASSSNRTNKDSNKKELVYHNSEHLTDDQLIESAFFFNMEKSPAKDDAAVALPNQTTKTPPVHVTIRNGLHGTKQSFVPPGSVSSVSSTTNLSSNYRQQQRQQNQQLGHSYEQQQQQQEPFHSKYHASPQKTDIQNQFGIDDIEDFSDDDHDHHMYKRNSSYTDRIIPQQLYDNKQMNNDAYNRYSKSVYYDDQIYPPSNVLNATTLPMHSLSLPASNGQQHHDSAFADTRIDDECHLNNHVGYGSNIAATTIHSPPFESIHQYTNGYDDDRYVDLSTMYDDDECNFQNNRPECMNQGFVNRVSDVSGAYIETYPINPGATRSVSPTFNNDPHEVIDIDHDPYQTHFPSHYETIADDRPTYINNSSRYGHDSSTTVQTSVMYHGQQEPPPNPPIGRRIRDSSKDPSYIQGVVLGHASKSLVSIPTAEPNVSVASMPRRFFRTSASTDTTKASLTSTNSNIPSHEPETVSVTNNHAPSQPPPTATTTTTTATAVSLRNSNSQDIGSYFPPVGTGSVGVMNRNRYYSNSVLANEVSKANQKPLVASSVHLRNDLQGGSGVGVGNFRLVKETVANYVKEVASTKSSNKKTNSTKPSYKRKKKGTGGRRGGGKGRKNNGSAASGRGGGGNYRNNVYNNHNNRLGGQQSQRSSSSSSSWGGNRDDPNLHNVGGADMNF